MKTIILFSPVFLKEKFQSGITIRLDGVSEWFINNGLRVIKTDKINKDLIAKGNIFYIMVSTRTNSISDRVVETIPYNKRLIVDLYTPIFLEKELSLNKFNIQDQFIRFKKRQIVKKIIKRGNHFLVANSRQKGYWQTTGKGLGVNLKSSILSIFPTDAPKTFTIKHKTSSVILWFGGIYPWMNPTPLIDAFSKVAPKYPDWKLLILGGFHPKTGYKKIYKEIIKSVRKNIPANQLEIVPWQSLYNLEKHLKDVSFAVHLTKKNQEDYYAHRVRLLTLLNAGIPVITNGKDVISDWIVKLKAGFRLDSNQKSLEKNMKLLINSPENLELFSKNAAQISGIYLKKETSTSRLFQFVNEN